MPHIDLFCLTYSYTPTFIWGRSGHIQTILHGIFGRFGKTPVLESEQIQLHASDEATVTYSIFRPKNDKKCVSRLFELPVIVHIIHFATFGS